MQPASQHEEAIESVEESPRLVDRRGVSCLWQNSQREEEMADKEELVETVTERSERPHPEHSDGNGSDNTLQRRQDGVIKNEDDSGDYRRMAYPSHPVIRQAVFLAKAAMGILR